MEKEIKLRDMGIVPDRDMGFVAGMMVKAMFAKSKGNVRVCTDMTKDPGVSINKEKIKW